MLLSIIWNADFPLFQVFGFNLYFSAFIIGLGLVLSYLILKSQLKSSRIGPDMLFLQLVCIYILSSRVGFFIAVGVSSGGQFDFNDFFDITKGGFTLLGGILGTIAFLWYYQYKLQSKHVTQALTLSILILLIFIKASLVVKSESPGKVTEGNLGVIFTKMPTVMAEKVLDQIETANFHLKNRGQKGDSVTQGRQIIMEIQFIDEFIHETDLRNYIEQEMALAFHSNETINQFMALGEPTDYSLKQKDEKFTAEIYATAYPRLPLHVFSTVILLLIWAGLKYQKTNFFNLHNYYLLFPMILVTAVEIMEFLLLV